MITCTNCHNTNRLVAKFCKKCGKSLLLNPKSSLAKELTDPLVTSPYDLIWNEIIGLGFIKAEFHDKIKVANRMKIANQRVDKRNFHTILVGKSGTGKSKLIDVIVRSLYQNGIIKSNLVESIPASDLPRYVQNFQPNLAKVRDGVLFIDGIHQILNYGDKSVLDKLYFEMEKSNGEPVVLLTTQPDDFDKYIEENPAIIGRFKGIYNLPEFTANQMIDVGKEKISQKGFLYDEVFEDKLKKRFIYLFRTMSAKSENNFAGINGFLVDKEISKIEERHYLDVNFDSANPLSLKPESIDDNIYESKSVEEILAELDDFIGMTNIKSHVKRLIEYAQFNERSNSKSDSVNTHLIITGNPGTGKTTLARKLGEIFAAAGLLTSGHTIEVDRSCLVGAYKGQTPALVQKFCDEAMGGVLFIDEAYNIVQNDRDDYGREAIDTLLKRIEDDRGKFIMIAAGYQKEMQNFLSANSGLKSRIGDNEFNLPDYTPSELYEILLLFIKKDGLNLSEEASNLAKQELNNMYRQRDQKFGNGRDVRNFFNEIIKNRSARIINRRDLNEEITKVDIPSSSKLVDEERIEKVLAQINEMVGLRGVKDTIQKISDYLQVEKIRIDAGGAKTNTNRHIIFRGNPGTGKTTVARIFGELFYEIGLLPKNMLVEAKTEDLVGSYVGETAIKTNKLIDSSIGGVLFIDEAYKLNPEYSTGSSGFAKEALETLMVRMENDIGKFIVILAGYPREMNDLLQANPGLSSRLPTSNYVDFEDYNEVELFSIFEGISKKEGITITPQASSKIIRVIQDMVRLKTKDFGNAREIRNLFEQYKDNQSARIISLKRAGLEFDSFILEEKDIISTRDYLDVGNILNSLNNLIGLRSVKDQLTELIKYLQIEEEKSQIRVEKNTINLHFVFKGNPGTGKTTVAKILGNIFKSIGVLPKGHVVEVTDKDLVAGYVGQTSIKTSKIIDSAIGGVLFIDEAYSLIPKNDNSFSQEAIDTLVQRMTADAGKFIVVTAGYDQDMDNFLNTNVGLRSRFSRIINFPDYNSIEMKEIYLNLLQEKGYQLGIEFEQVLDTFFSNVEKDKDKSFANGRTVKNHFDQTIINQSVRLTKLKEQGLPYNVLELSPSDLPKLANESFESVESILADLNQLIGLSQVKTDINNVINFLNIEKQRITLGNKESIIGMHSVFSGRPGTGKTTVARLLAKIYKSLGILPKGHLVEVDRKDLVGKYIGHTADLTSKIIDKAMGGVLFIDEAYTLTPENAQNDFGQEAIDTLLTRMENDRGKFIVIAAGYPKDIQRFLNSNEGLTSRFSKTIYFEDYNSVELAQIFCAMVESKNLKMDNIFRDNIANYFTENINFNDSTFANGRTVRNIFEKSLQNQANRLASLSKFSPEDIIKLEFEDLP